MSDGLPGPIHREMTPEDCRDFPRHLGWKYEYYGGKIHVTPYSAMVPLYIDLDTAARRSSGKLPSGLTLRGVEAADEQRLFALFIAAFSTTIDFAGYRPKKFVEEARKCLRRHFGERRGRRLEASRVAEDGDELVGAFLLREFERGALLDIVFVDPARQRSGIAGRLLAEAARELRDDGHARLYSSCVLGNTTSLAWHERCGFCEQPHLQILKLRAWHCREELERRQRLGDSNDRELHRLAEAAEGWEELYRKLEEAVGDSYEAGHPLYY